VRHRLEQRRVQIARFLAANGAQVDKGTS
jgi:hypothetical protein